MYFSGDAPKGNGSPSSAWSACPTPPLGTGNKPSPWDKRLGLTSPPLSEPTDRGIAPSSGLPHRESPPTQPSLKRQGWEGSLPSPASSQGSTTAPQRRGGGGGARRSSPEGSGVDGSQEGGRRRRQQGRGKHGSPQQGQAASAGQRGEVYWERSDGKPPRSVT